MCGVGGTPGQLIVIHCTLLSRLEQVIASGCLKVTSEMANSGLVPEEIVKVFEV